ncbi:MAG: phosphate starvation-inducible protein PhoH [Alphaproteobacteria bacterium RIFCSPLOWO2_01_FULL_45_8]|nr:MAG: phosphate starvation-inducible protein PhoH [Alphaproteobacteria bacterium GWB1_45_5]OFW76108.1 MAG: phosphate starvation-inducible protein PhoH [Alphaproteobacteria bacterium GWA1_45_9]OFW90233.1 MAG: phosphate starvation-inducible protein PhoH [Alphaproteobacteria bacterium RIFCSPHIGHO2_01_FULL_41_14]OFW96722.1 MAG: phosphate starvation-inducible protein PhoH [Alphaproteobacteria bacterium RIFCSPLOWO2_01_FULL_45_8]
MTEIKTTPILESILEFSDNQVLQQLVGSHNEHLKKLESQFEIKVCLRGNFITLVGEESNVQQAKTVLTDLYHLLETGGGMNQSDVTRHFSKGAVDQTDIRIKLKTEDRVIVPRNKNQSHFIHLLQKHDLVFGVGPAGTGKTYMAVAMGVSLLMAGHVDRLVLSRPAIEAGEKLGFLPGDLKEKIDPYLRPIFDALHDMFSPSTLEKLMVSGIIEVAPLAFMRGRTLSHSYIILDEAQNTTAMQMKMFLTRLGENARMVITGDMTQIDLPPHQKSGLVDALEKLEKIPDIGVMKFSQDDVVRHPLVGQVLKAYDGD